MDRHLGTRRTSGPRPGAVTEDAGLDEAEPDPGVVALGEQRDGAEQDLIGLLGAVHDRLYRGDDVGVVAHERITPSTSSRRLSISASLWASRLRRSSGSVFDGRTLKRQLSCSIVMPSRCEMRAPGP